MQYKTIVLDLIQERPDLHQSLRHSRTLLSTMNEYALALKNCHEAWKVSLATARPNSDPQQIASEAMEVAIAQFEENLPQESQPNDDPLSLDAAMEFLKRPSPSA